MTKEFGAQPKNDDIFRSPLSRRAMLRRLAATAIATTGLVPCTETRPFQAAGVREGQTGLQHESSMM
jgi:hypothetical protein